MEKRLTATIITAVLVVLLIVANFAFKLDLGSRFESVLAPIEIVLGDFGTSVSGFFSGIGKISSLEKDNSRLTKDLATATTEIAALSQDKIENDSLLKDLNFTKTSSLSYLSGEVVTFDPTLKNGINVRVPDPGSVRKGAMVTAEGFMIGKVDSISGDIVRVNLLTDPTSAIPVNIQGKQIAGVAKGQIGNGLTCDQVPQGESVAVSDVVVTSGLGGDFMAGIALGKVSNVGKSSGSIFQQIDLSPMVDVLKIHYVMIAK